MARLRWKVVLVLLLVVPILPGMAAPLATAAKEAAEFIIQKFGKRVPSQTVDELATAIGGAAAKYGDSAVPFLRAAGHAGFDALERAGPKAPEVIKLYIKKGDEGVWVITTPDRLALFLRHGEEAADALLRHPGVADTLIARHGAEAVGALNQISQQNAQRLGISAAEGLLTATPRSPELLGVIRRHGDRAMNFVWANKAALVDSVLLAAFLAEPEAYLAGARILVQSFAARLAEIFAKGGYSAPIVSTLLFCSLVFLVLRIKTRKRRVSISRVKP
jgi:hypothetical protein